MGCGIALLSAFTPGAFLCFSYLFFRANKRWGRFLGHWESKWKKTNINNGWRYSPSLALRSFQRTLLANNFYNFARYARQSGLHYRINGGVLFILIYKYLKLVGKSFSIMIFWTVCVSVGISIPTIYNSRTKGHNICS